MRILGSIRSSRSHNICLFVIPLTCCLEHSILFFIAQIFKLISQHSPSSLSSSNFIGETEPRKLHLVHLLHALRFFFFLQRSGGLRGQQRGRAGGGGGGGQRVCPAGCPRHGGDQAQGRPHQAAQGGARGRDGE